MQGDFYAIFEALAQVRARYLVVGGVAVVLQGHLRVTADVDLVIALDGENVLAVLGALASIGYKPRLPVDPKDFADPSIRRAWIEEKGMMVFSLWHPAQLRPGVDLFVEEPFPLAEALERADVVKVGAGVVPVASIPDLIALKRDAGRPQDLLDVAKLEAIARLREKGHGDGA